MNTSAGSTQFLGARQTNNGANFALYSRDATTAQLLLFDEREDRTPANEIELHPQFNRTGDIWHIFVEGLKEGSLYAWRVDGSRDAARPLRESGG